MSLPVNFSIGTLPITCWPDDPNYFAQLIAAALQGNVAYEFGGIVYSVSEPDSAYRGNTGWFDLNDFNLYFWNTTVSKWVRPHQVPPSSKVRMMWVGTSTELQTFDGGEAGSVTAAGGPFWEIDTDFAAKFPIGAGTLPISSTVVNPGDTGGLEKVTLTADDVQHFHGVGTDGLTDDPFNMLHRDWTTSPTTYVQRYNDLSDLSGTGWQDGPAITSGTGGTTKALTDPDATTTAHQNMPPYRGVHIIKRTARVWITAP